MHDTVVKSAVAAELAEFARAKLAARHGCKNRWRDYTSNASWKFANHFKACGHSPSKIKSAGRKDISPAAVVFFENGPEPGSMCPARRPTGVDCRKA